MYLTSLSRMRRKKGEGREGGREGGRYLAGPQEIVFARLSQLGLKIPHVHLEQPHVLVHHLRDLREGGREGGAITEG